MGTYCSFCTIFNALSSHFQHHRYYLKNYVYTVDKIIYFKQIGKVVPALVMKLFSSELMELLSRSEAQCLPQCSLLSFPTHSGTNELKIDNSEPCLGYVVPSLIVTVKSQLATIKRALLCIEGTVSQENVTSHASVNVRQ